MGQPSLCIKKMHTIFFYFIYSTKTDKKLYNNYTNQSHQTQVPKHHQTSTTLEEKIRPCASAAAIVDSEENPKKAPCAQAPEVTSTSLSLSPRTHL
jgi:hypothetical protein